MPNIVQQLLSEIENNDSFFLEESNEDLKRSAIKFLDAKKNSELEQEANTFMENLLKPHEKSETLLTPLNTLRIYEKDNEWNRKEHRLHFAHALNVYLLGLFLYHKNDIVNKAINQDIKNTPHKIKYKYDGVEKTLNFSGGNCKGEFNYRWKLASLCHDIGYPIELARNSHLLLKEYLLDLKRIQMQNESEQDSAYVSEQDPMKDYLSNITHFHDLSKVFNWDMLEEIDRSIPSVKIREYNTYLEKHPDYTPPVYYDHGIYGSLLFLGMMHTLFSKKPEVEESQNRKVIWHNKLLHGVLRRVACSIAMHNLDSHKYALEYSRLPEEKLYVLHGNSLTWLLKISDELQEWYRSPIDTHEQLEEAKISLMFNNKIEIHGYPKKANKIFREKLDSYYAPSNLIKLI